MDKYELYLMGDSGKRNITELVGNFSWTDSIDTLGVQFKFDFARNKKDKYLSSYDILEIGDKIVLFNNRVEVLRGILVSINTTTHAKTATAFDYAFYLNKSETIIQFYKQEATKAIQKVCGQFGITVSIGSLATNITKIYKDATVGSIVADILKQVTQETGKKFFYEMQGTVLHIREVGFETITATYQPSNNVAPFDVTKNHGELTASETMEDMKNSVIVVSNEENDNRIIATAKDNSGIGKYGLLQEIVTVDKKDSSKANNIAKNELKNLNKVKKEISVPLMGSDKIKCGRKLTFSTDDLSGTYLIKSSSHTIAKGIHQCEVNLEVI